jgi:small subunit ribosomal protein S6
MRKYELMYIARPDIEQEQLDAVAERVKGVIVDGGGEVTNLEVKGKRRLAYEIKKFKDGVYVLVNFTADAQVVSELDRILRISDDVIRHLIIKDET